MKKTIAILIAGAFAFTASAQEDEKMQNIDWQEDSTEIMSIQDIINEQQQITTHNMRESHFNDVWSRRSYFNIGYSSTSLRPEDDIPVGLGSDKLGTLSAKWGLALQSGRGYRLHKEPIANTVQFCLDYTWIDLNVNFFDSQGGPILYDSSLAQEDDKDKYQMPWNLKKYEAGYGMTLGPSISVCPFNMLDAPLLHYLQLHFFYHIGYQLSVIFMTNNEDADANQSVDATAPNTKRHKQMKDNMKGLWGHGLSNSFGVSLTWKSIGIGYEHLSSKTRYKPFSTGDFGKDTDKFTLSRNRIFIQFKM